MIRTRAGTVLTEHAVEAMLERSVGPDELDAILDRPDLTRPDRSCGYEPRAIAWRRDVGVVTAVRGGVRVVVTVLYRGATAAQGAGPRPSGRALSRLTRRRLLAELQRERARRAVGA